MARSTTQRIAANTVYLFVSQLLTWGMSLAVAIILPRYFGAAGIGSYHLAASLWNLTAMLVGFGTDVVITRQIARDESQTSALVGVGVLLRVLFHLIGFSILAVFVNISGYSAETVQIVYIFGAANLIYQVGHIFSAALYGLERMGRLSIVDIVTELVSVGGILILVFAKQSITAVALVSILAGSTRTLLLFVLLRQSYPLTFQIPFHLVRWLLRESVSILGNRLIRTVYAQADVIVISLFVNETVVGWYSVADVAFSSLLFVPNIIGTALFPAFARYFKEDQAQLTVIARQAFRRLLLVILPIGLGTAVIATPLVVLIVGEEFTPSGPVLSGFGIVAVFTAINIFLAQLLIAMGRQNRLTLLMTIGIIITIPIDLFLIPWTQANWGNGAIGGVIAYFFTESFIAVGSFISLPKDFWDAETRHYALKAVLAALVMTAVVLPFRHFLLFFPILVGGATYSTMVFLLRLVSWDDIEFVRNLIRRKGHLS
ncbi:MAG: flippase [Candidatus Promineifilaceae bacterium]